MARTFTYTPQVSPEDLLRMIENELSAFGAIHFQGDVAGGKVEGMGVHAGYEVRENEEGVVVAIDVQSKPIFIPWKLVKNRLDSFFAQIG